MQSDKMFDRLLKAFTPRDKKSRSRPLLRFTARKTHDDNRNDRSWLRKRPELASASVLSPSGDSPSVDALRGWSRSSPPPRTREPTPHPSASKPQNLNLKREKTVRFGSPLEVHLGTPAEEEGKTTTKRSDSTTPTKEPMTRTTEGDGNTLGGSLDVKVTANEARRLQPSRRGRGSSLPRPKHQVSEQDSTNTTSSATDTPERPLSPLIPQAAPAPLRIRTKRQSRARPITSSASVPVATAKPKGKFSTIDASKKKEPTNADSGNNHKTRPSRDYSFEKKPEVLATSSRSSRIHHDAIKPDNKMEPSKPTSYLKCEPRRPGFASAVKTQTANVVKPTVALTKSSTTPSSSCQDTQDLYNKLDSKGNDNSDASGSMRNRCATPFVKNSQHTCSVPSKPPASADPVPSSSLSFHAAKSFWSELGTTSSPELSSYTVNTPSHIVDVGTKRSSAVVPRINKSTTGLRVAPVNRSSKIPKRTLAVITSSRTESDLSKTTASSVASYHTAKTHLAPSNVGGSTTSATASVATCSSSMQADHTPSIQSQLWNDLMDFCTPDRDAKSKLSSCAPYCACDDCLWQNEIEVDLSSTVARVGRQ
ncbi:hypothetical protein QBC32DRAFT_396746 [Pseudoneurospora amorphoporcata]|uniref:Uncharacterized protein n=1 Tax=Pseudoneurospora amorphoporcata TaxID=241081 RepID=A0AAN6P184_9PEZI|nr:hypothetical protein QBC32DRAFT_396746 [Pseudoneurospora amorphoporcata]